jgi:hypothetical protein
MDISITGLPGGQGNLFTCKALVAWQGHITIGYPKKNLKMDLLDESGNSVKLFIGKWVPQDSFHFKADYNDATKSRQITSYRIYEQMRQTREWNKRRPFYYYSDFAAWSPELNNETGALCHPDGFPCEIYINGDWYGLFMFQLSKHRSNYLMNKSNQNHLCIQIAEPGVSLGGSENIYWPYWEIRNPKISGYNEGDIPADGLLVKEKFEELNDWVRTVTTYTTKEEIEQHLIIEFWIDWFILVFFTGNKDVVSNNDMYCSWDGGLHWAVVPYDFDNTFGMWTGNVEGTYPLYDTGIVFGNLWNAIKVIYAEEIKERISELYSKNILTAENVVSMASDNMETIGLERLKKEYEKWPNAPSLPTAANGITKSATLKQLENMAKCREFSLMYWGFLDYYTTYFVPIGKTQQ